MTLRCLISLVAAGACLGAGIGAWAPTANAASPSACFGSGAGTDSVIHFYLAIDQRQFMAAYQCFSPAEAASLSFEQFKKSYAHTVAAKLAYADDLVPNGRPATSVQVEIHLFNRSSGVFTRTIQTGSWAVDSAHRLGAPSLTSDTPVKVAAVSPTQPKMIFKTHKLTVVRHMGLTVTGSGVADIAYFTDRPPCGECRNQQVWIYRQDNLVYEQEVDNPQLIPWGNHLAMQIRTDTPGTRGVDTSHPSSRTYLTWFWTQFGFTLHSHKIVTFGGSSPLFTPSASF